MTSEDEYPPGALVFKPTQRRTFKACRTCRLQKSRCIGADDPPCRRCIATGRDCVFEQLGRCNSKKRSQPSSSLDGQEQEKRSRANELSRARHQPLTPIDGQRGPQEIAPGQHDTGLSPRISHREGNSESPSGDSRTTSNAHCLVSVEGPESSQDLTMLDLEAPITTVHALTTTTTFPPSPSSIQSQHGDVSAVLPNQKHTSRYNDIISHGHITESEGRKLFQLYMANSNVFHPLFDPAVDTFDAIRQRSTFCFTVILAIALRADGSDSSEKIQVCFTEARNLAANSLFSNSNLLETIQAMVLLAAHSESNRFAISHAYQMGQDMGLFKLFPRDVEDTRNYDKTQPDHRNRRLLGRMRTAFVLHQVEQEVASGTGREPRGSQIQKGFLRNFLEKRGSTVYDMRIISNVEVTQLRGRLMQDLDLEQSLSGGIERRLLTLEKEINSWFDHWDSEFEGHGFSIVSFQRSSIRLQADYAFIIITSAIISKLSKELSRDSTAADIMTGEMVQLVEDTFQRSVKILRLITDHNDYKWHLQWAPTYSTLFPAFTAALAFRLAKIRPGPTDWTDLRGVFASVADILQKCPYRNFAVLIRDLSRLMPEGSYSNYRVEEARVGGAALEFGLGCSQNDDTAETRDALSPRTRSSHRQDSPDASHASNSLPWTGCKLLDDQAAWINSPVLHNYFQGTDLLPESLDTDIAEYSLEFSMFATSMQGSTDLLD